MSAISPGSISCDDGTCGAWRGALLAILLMLCGGFGGTRPASAGGISSAVEQASLSNGMVLVAARNMADPRFVKTVVLLVDHNDGGGSLGLILNRRSTVLLGDLVSSLAEKDTMGHPVYAGGPVGMDQVLFLVRHPRRPDRALKIMRDLYASGELQSLEAMLAEHKPRNRLHVYLGYAGWSPRQLAGEVERGDWHVAPGTLDDVFTDRPEVLWSRRIQSFEPEGLRVEAVPSFTRSAISKFLSSHQIAGVRGR